MRDAELTVPDDGASHLTWVRTKMTLDQELLESVRYGFSLIAAGFGSFAVFDGIAIGERAFASLPRTFALAATAVGIVVILLAVRHARKMTAWIDADEFGAGPVPRLPDEDRTVQLASGGVLIGVVSFVALLLLP